MTKTVVGIGNQQLQHSFYNQTKYPGATALRCADASTGIGSYGYTLDLDGKRLGATLPDGKTWAYGYDRNRCHSAEGEEKAKSYKEIIPFNRFLRKILELQGSCDKNRNRDRKSK